MGITSPSFSGGAGIVTSDKIVSADLEIDGTTIVVDETNNRVGVGTGSPGVQLDVHDTTTSSANTGGALRLSANDGAAMGDSHRLGVIEFTGAEDSSGTQTVGARIEAMTDAAWTNAENGGALYFYTTDGNASQTNVLKLDSNKKATFAGDVVVNNAFAAAGASGTFGTFADGDATPSVAAGNLWKHHASTQTITMFDDGLIGQTIHVISTAAITYDVTSTNLKGGSADIVTASGDITSWFFDGTNWYLVQFMDVSADHSSIGGSGASLSGTTNNTVATVTGANALIGEANLTFDGSTLTVPGAQIVKRVILDTSSTTSYNVLAADYYIGVGSAGGTAQALTINLQAVSGLTGRVIIIKDESGECGLYNITIDGNGSEIIDGQTTQVMNSNYASVTLVCNGASWSIV